jgi:hypothetical protein
MARLARVVVPDHPHHVTQRGNGRALTFFDDSDYALYRPSRRKLPRERGRSVGAAESVGRPLGDDDFLASIERLTGRPIKPSKRGPKPSRSESRLRALSPNHELN